MEDTHDIYTISGLTKVDGVPFHVSPLIPGSDMVARGGPVRRIGQYLECLCQPVDIAVRLIDTPPFSRTLPDML